ncbi:aldo/keto reductase [Yinghuangia sp. ASG 101]|uniref:aldo/keto reductase n=1 Tax=Yinghuangia sp. ASG 101 TaxID=2896848 RepID=UPI001E4E754E|nr:aldo/keto reductase [Yinghuangia sp. ASG 101]UGQ13491.1 aldo/keto reductase [Yinghuangia sp. ASG 101]
MRRDHLAAAPIPRIGLGLAAIGRPGYINLGRDTDLPTTRSVDALRARAHVVLDTAYDRGVRYVDTARSYGLADNFLAEWLRSRPEARDVVVGSKWGYTYTADWSTHADVHEVKNHGVAAYDRQLAETRALLGDRLGLYQIHSVTPDSPALTDTALHERLAALADAGVTVGLSTSGPGQAEAIRAALAITVDGLPLFASVQATYNLMERSAGRALAEAHAAGRVVIVKEALANGRLTDRHAREPATAALRATARESGVSCDALALAAVLAQPWVDVVLSGAVTTEQLASNLTAATLHLAPDQLGRLAELTEPPEAYWAHRSRLTWA